VEPDPPWDEGDDEKWEDEEGSRQARWLAVRLARLSPPAALRAPTCHILRPGPDAVAAVSPIS